MLRDYPFDDNFDGITCKHGMCNCPYHQVIKIICQWINDFIFIVNVVKTVWFQPFILIAEDFISFMTKIDNTLAYLRLS